MEDQFTPQGPGLTSFEPRLEANGEDSSCSESFSFPSVVGLGLGLPKTFSQSKNKTRPLRRLPVRIPMPTRNMDSTTKQRTPSIADHPWMPIESKTEDSVPLMSMPDNDTFPFSHNVSGSTAYADKSLTQPQTKNQSGDHHWLLESGRKNRQCITAQQYPSNFTPRNKPTIFSKDGGNSGSIKKAAPSPVFSLGRKVASSGRKERTPSRNKIGFATYKVVTPCGNDIGGITNKAVTPRRNNTGCITNKAVTPRKNNTDGITNKTVTPRRNNTGGIANSATYFSATKTRSIYTSTSKKTSYSHATPLHTIENNPSLSSCKRGELRGKVLQEVFLNGGEATVTPDKKHLPQQRGTVHGPNQDKENAINPEDNLVPLDLKVTSRKEGVAVDYRTSCQVGGNEILDAISESLENNPVEQTDLETIVNQIKESERAYNAKHGIDIRTISAIDLYMLRQKLAREEGKPWSTIEHCTNLSQPTPLVPATCKAVVAPVNPSECNPSADHSHKENPPSQQSENIPYMPSLSAQQSSSLNPSVKQPSIISTLASHPSSVMPSSASENVKRPSVAISSKTNPCSHVATMPTPPMEPGAGKSIHKALEHDRASAVLTPPVIPGTVKPTHKALEIPSVEEVRFSMPAARPVDNRTLQVNSKSYSIVSQLGKGGSSIVYQVLDGSRMLAVKVVTLQGLDRATAQGYLNEVSFLRKLQNCENVIHLVDYEYIRKSQTLLVVLEKGDTDLSHLLKEIGKTRKISPLAISYYWSEMVNAVATIHEHGIIHSDLKPANFLLVSGRLKLIDFGIASALNKDMTSVVKDQIVGTFNYMSPEAVGAGMGKVQQGQKISFKSDVWSLGCILYNLVYGRPPFAHIVMGMAKLVAISDPGYKIPYPVDPSVPPVLVSIIRRCLTYEPSSRPTAAQLLQLPLLPRLEDPSIMERIKSMVSPEVWDAINT